MDTKTERLFMRLTPSEKEEIRNRARKAGMTVSEYLRSVIKPKDDQDTTKAHLPARR